jgi:hypothetical protein
MLLRISLFTLLLILSGCATYRTPGAGAALPGLTASAALADRRPAASFPAQVALVRLQAADYGATSPACHGTGSYCVMTTRTVESGPAIRRLEALPRLAGLVRLPPERLPNVLDTLDALRPASAAAGADLLLLYTIDTRFTVDQAEYAPLTDIKPGFLPNRGARVTATTSGELVDAQTGYVYGRAEATVWRDQNAAVWASRGAIEDERRITERASFETFAQKFTDVWQDVLTTYAGR